MSFLTTFVVGLVTGSAVWQWGRSKHVNVPQTVAVGAGLAFQSNDVQDAPADGPVVVANDTTQPIVNASVDDLTLIRGIGPVYAQRLNAAGIQNFSQLAELAPEQISAIVIQGNIDHRIDTRDWIGQAQELVEPQPS